MAVGSRDISSIKGHNKAELYFNSTSSWKSLASYPFYEQVWDFQILAHSDFFTVFGGLAKDDVSLTSFKATNIIANFSPAFNKWVKLGFLQYARHAFGMTETTKSFSL